MPALQPVLQLLGVDAVVDQLLADVVERLGQAQHLLGALAAVGQCALDAQQPQGALPGGRIGRLSSPGSLASGASRFGIAARAE